MYCTTAYLTCEVLLQFVLLKMQYIFTRSINSKENTCRVFQLTFTSDESIQFLSTFSECLTHSKHCDSKTEMP